MADGTNDVKEEDANPLDSLPLGSQAAEDFAMNHYGVAKTGQLLDRDGDGVPDYADAAPDKAGTDSDGDDDNDDDDDAEADADSLADLEDDDNDLINNNDYKNIDRDGSRFNDAYRNASADQRAAVDTAKQAEQAALQGPRNADGFVALQKARIDERLAATAIVANNGSGTDAQTAATGNQKLTAMDRKFAQLETDMQGKTEAQKDAILAKAFPAQWQKFEEGTPQQAASARSSPSYSATQNDLPGNGINKSIDLSGQFAKVNGTAPAPSSAPTVPVSPTVRAPTYQPPTYAA